jgi:hypothetical protein
MEDQHPGLIFEPFTMSPDISELAKAMAKAQSVCVDPKRSEENTAFRRGSKAFKYASLEAVLTVVRTANAETGLSLIMPPAGSGNMAGVEWIVMHESGQWMRGKCLLPVVTVERGGGLVSNMTPQEIGKAITYASRYSASRVYNIASQDDDDGNSISGVHDDGHTEPARTPPASTPLSTRSTTSAVAPAGAPAAAARTAPDPNARATGQHKEALSAALTGRHVDPLNVAARNAFGVAVLSAGYPGSFKDLTGHQCDVLIMAAEEGPDAMPDAQLQSIWRQHTPKPAPAQEPDPFGDE